MSNTSVSLKDVFEITNRIETKLDCIETRISALEMWKAVMIGKIGLLIGIITFFTTLVWENLKEKLGFK